MPSLDICGKYFAHYDAFSRHLWQVLRTLRCLLSTSVASTSHTTMPSLDICGKYFAHYDAFSRHLWQVLRTLRCLLSTSVASTSHTTMPSLDICGKYFAHYDAFSRHLWQVLRTLRCLLSTSVASTSHTTMPSLDICGKYFAHYDAFSRHLWQVLRTLRCLLAIPDERDCGGLTTAICHDFTSATAKCELRVLGLFGKMFTGPWMKRFYTSSATSQITHIEGIGVAKAAVNKLTLQSVC